MKALSIFLLFVTCSLIQAQVTCDIFKINTKIEADILTFNLETDLPDEAILMVSIGRSFTKTSKGDIFTLNFYDEKTTVKKLKQPQKIDVSDSIFKAAMERNQKAMKALSLGFKIHKISDDIEIRMVLPVNQKAAEFGGKRNEKLTGKKVAASGLKIISEEVRVKKPYGIKVTKELPEKLPVDYDDPFGGLDMFKKSEMKESEITVGKSYLLSGKEVEVTLKKNSFTIPAGGMIKIRKIVKQEYGSIIYQVIAYGENLTQLGICWLDIDYSMRKILSLHEPITNAPQIINKEILINSQNGISIDCIDQNKLEYDEILTYQKVKVIKVSYTGIRIIHSSGVTTIPIEQLPSEIRENLSINYKNTSALTSQDSNPQPKKPTIKPKPVNEVKIDTSRWVSNQGGISITYSLIKTNGQYNLKRDFADGGSINCHVVVKSKAGKIHLNPKTPIPSGDYWIIVEGSLACMDSEGVICIAKPPQATPPRGPRRRRR